MVDQGHGPVLAVAGGRHRGRGDEAAAPLSRFDEALAAELLVGFLDRAAGGAQLFGQLAFGRKLVSGTKLVGLDGGFDVMNDLSIGGGCAGRFIQLQI